MDRPSHSQAAARIRRAWENISDEEAVVVLAHLSRMQTESGWIASRRAAADSAQSVQRDQSP